LAACHAIPLNAVGGAVHVTTGRRLRESPPEAETVAVMLDGGCAFQGLEGAEYTIYWGAYLGMPQEIALSGPLDEMAGRIVEVRAEAREAHGWIMDTYLLRRR
ncbi:precorrin-6A synthase (deacetylating), partial [Amaricoccus sp. HAR-UPW-R2A-40]